MKKLILFFATAAFASSFPSAAAQPEPTLLWTTSQIRDLNFWIEHSATDALGTCRGDTVPVSEDKRDLPTVSKAATIAALKLARAYLYGCEPDRARAHWYIHGQDDYVDLESELVAALNLDNLNGFYKSLRPRRPEYQELRSSYQVETDPGKRSILATNMERWRWMPLSLGRKFLLVNAASFEATLWVEDKKVDSWRVIVGKPPTPTPVFDATVAGVVLNPWWNVPQSIVAESVGALVRNNPARARRKGYVVQNGRYRQKPGPGNALGQMKLVMHNPYSIYLHDTPNKTLFEKDVRTFSHGCIRVGGALNLAATLLQDVVTQEKIDTILESRVNTVIDLPRPFPVYITYFTAEPVEGGAIQYFDDVYRRDKRAQLAARDPGAKCPA